MKDSPMPNRTKLLWFLIVPAMLFLAAYFLSNARGPYYLGCFDPEYAYLMNSLDFSQGKPILYVGHPGTPVITLGAMVLKADQFLFQRAEPERYVLENPEHYLDIFQFMLVGLISLAIFFLGTTIYFFAKSIWLSWFAQLSIFFSVPVAWEGLTRMSPEPLLVFITVSMVCLFFYVQVQKPILRMPWIIIIYLGFYAVWLLLRK